MNSIYALAKDLRGISRNGVPPFFLGNNIADGIESACKANDHTAQGCALGDGSYRGRIIKRVLKVLPLQGDDVVLLPTQGVALG